MIFIGSILAVKLYIIKMYYFVPKKIKYPDSFATMFVPSTLVKEFCSIKLWWVWHD